MKFAKWRLILLLILARPLPANAEITLGITEALQQSSSNLLPIEDDKDLVWQAVHILANEPKLENHPIRRYLYDPDILAQVWFDDFSLQPIGALAVADMNNIYIKPGEDLAYYLESMAHEFIHVDMAEKYVSSSSGYSFLYPEDFAFCYLIGEAFANTYDSWLRLTFPQEMNSDYQILTYQFAPTDNGVIDAMRNDLRLEYPEYDDKQITNMVIENIFTKFMTGWFVAYSMQNIPQEMKRSYGEGNTFLIPEYAAYRERGDALLRHQWDYLLSIMPFTLPANMTYDYFRSQFKDNYTMWAEYADEYVYYGENTVLDWINYDYEGAARGRIAGKSPEDVRYDYLTPKDEANLNRVFHEIDPTFTPVDTWRAHACRH